MPVDFSVPPPPLFHTPHLSSLTSLFHFIRRHFKDKDLDPRESDQWATAAMDGWAKTGWAMEKVRKKEKRNIFK